MKVRILPERWVADRRMFMFRCELDVEYRWTFCVTQQTLEELDDDAYYDRGGIFDAFRARIYEVARNRMACADNAEQHQITAEEIKNASPVREARR